MVTYNVGNWYTYQLYSAIIDVYGVLVYDLFVSIPHIIPSVGMYIMFVYGSHSIMRIPDIE